MAKSKQNNTIKVPQAEIDKIRSLGMAKAIKEAQSGNASREFVEGVRRFYPAAVANIDQTTAKRATSGKGVKVPDSKKKSSPKSEEVTPSRDAVARRFASTNSAGAASKAKGGKKDTSFVRPHPQGRGSMVDFGPSDQGIKGLDDKVRRAMKNLDSDTVRPHRSGRGTEINLSPGNRGIKGIDDYLVRNIKGAGKEAAKVRKVLGNLVGKTGNRLPRR